MVAAYRCHNAYIHECIHLLAGTSLCENIRKAKLIQTNLKCLDNSKKIFVMEFVIYPVKGVLFNCLAKTFIKKRSILLHLIKIYRHTRSSIPFRQTSCRQNLYAFVVNQFWYEWINKWMSEWIHRFISIILLL